MSYLLLGVAAAVLTVPGVFSDHAAPKLVKQRAEVQRRSFPTGNETPLAVEKIVARLAENFRLAEKHLAIPEEGEATRQTQQKILDDLDALIKYSVRAQQPRQRMGTQDGPGPGTPQPDLVDQQAAIRSVRSEPRSTPAARDQKKPAKSAATTREDISKIADVWGHLPEERRPEMDQYSGVKFMDKYQELTKQYYIAIAEKSRKKETRSR
jgi:hypothetical protein